MQLFHAATFAAHHSASIRLMQNWFHGSTQARGQALYTTVAYGLGGTIGGLVSGWIWEGFGPNYTFMLSALACVLGYLCIAKSARRAVPTQALFTSPSN